MVAGEKPGLRWNDGVGRPQPAPSCRLLYILDCSSIQVLDLLYDRLHQQEANKLKQSKPTHIDITNRGCGLP